MQKISEGYFYEVYDLGSGRVLKKRRPFSKILEDIRKKYKCGLFKGIIKTFDHIHECNNSTYLIKERFKNIPLGLFGNPLFINNVEYKQDKTILLMDYFANHDLEENKIMIDKYIELVKTLLKYSIHDRVYKFKNSYGINDKEEVVWIDFNEVTFSKEKTSEYAKNMEWKNELQFKKFPEGELKEYLNFKFSEALTPQNVDKLWGTMT